MASNAIKGITVEIGGDTSKLGKALEAGEKKSKELQSELRNIDKALKFNPKSVELLTQKQEVLTQQVAETEKAFNTLKEAESQVAAQAKSGEITAEQYRAFQRELIETESKLNNYRNKLSTVESDMKDLGDEADKTGKDLKELGNDADKAGKDIDDFEKDVEEAEKAMKEAGDSAKQFGEDLATIGGAAVAGITAAITTANSVETAMNSLQAQTGATDEQMQGLGESMKNLYLENYGESMDQLANYMARVAQYTGETDPSKIEDMTKNLITLEDTFEMDFGETLRGVDNLMKHMGVDAETAFDLIAKGAQNGLDKSGELGDNIAEYAQLWAQAGFSAVDMFTILDNGLDAGAYNLDKVNDFVKEFTISLSDGRIEENLTSFSKGTQDLFKGWKKGEKTAEQVFKSVITDLQNCKTEQEALTLAGTVWSALGEDNAMSIITSLTNVNDTFTTVRGTMESVNEIKYDDIGNRFAALGRTVMTDVVAPLGQKLLPTAEKLVSYLKNNLDDIIPIATQVGKAIIAAFALKTVSDFITAVKNIGSAFTLLAAHPIAATVVAIGALAIACTEAGNRLHAIVEEEWGLSEANKAANEAIAESYDAYKTAQEAQSKRNAGIEAEIGHCQNLWAELQKITDENGKIQAGYEKRATVITGQLADALGVEIGIVDGQIQKYQELSATIDEVIAKKRASLMLDANEQAYTDAVAGSTEALNTYMGALGNLEETQNQVTEAETAYAEALAEHNRVLAESKGHNPKKYERQLAQTSGALVSAKLAVDEATKAHEENKDAVAKAGEAYFGYQNTIANYEGAMEAVASGDIKAMDDALTKLSNNFVTADNATKEMLLEQQQNYHEMYENMKTAVDEGMPGVSQAQVDAMKKLYDSATNEFVKFLNQSEETGKDTGDSYVDGIEGKADEAGKAGETVGDSAKKGMESADTKPSGEKAGDNFAAGVEGAAGEAKSAGAFVAGEGKSGAESIDFTGIGLFKTRGFASGMIGASGEANAAGVTVADKGKQGANSVDFSGTGANKGDEFAGGVASKAGEAGTAGEALAGSAKGGADTANLKQPGQKAGDSFNKGVQDKVAQARTKGAELAKKAKAGAGSANAQPEGENLAEGFGIGISNKTSSIWTRAWNLAKNALDAIKAATAEKSPSKEAQYLGEFLSQGFAIGIDKDADKAADSAGAMATGTLERMRKDLDIHSPSKATEYIGQMFTAGIEKGIAEGAAGVVSVISDLYGKMIEAEKLYENESKKVEIGEVPEALTSYYDDMVEAEKAYLDLQNRIDLGEVPEALAEAYKKVTDAEAAYKDIEHKINIGQLSWEEEYRKLLASRGIEDMRPYIVGASASDYLSEIKKDVDQEKKIYEKARKDYVEGYKKAYDDKKDAYDDATSDYLNAFKEDADKEKKIYEDTYSYAEELFSRIDTVVADAYASIGEAIAEVEEKQKSFSDTLYAEIEKPYTKKETTKGNTTTIGFDLANFEEENARLTIYQNLFNQLVEKRGEINAEIRENLAGMSMEEGQEYLTAMLNASDDDWNAYISGMEQRRKLTDEIAGEVYDIDTYIPGIVDEAKGNLADGLKNIFAPDMSTLVTDEMTVMLGNAFAAFDSVDDDTKAIGEQAINGIISGIDAMTPALYGRMASIFDALGFVTSGGSEYEHYLNGASGTVNGISYNADILSRLDGIYNRLANLQIVLDSGTLVGETIDKIDAGLAGKQEMATRGVR